MRFSRVRTAYCDDASCCRFGQLRILRHQFGLHLLLLFNQFSFDFLSGATTCQRQVTIATAAAFGVGFSKDLKSENFPENE
jgi:hypothetical protein